MYTYKENAKLFQSLRCEISLSYIAVLVLLSLLLSDPVYLLAMFIALNLVIVSAGIMQEWRVYLKYCFVLIIMIGVINALFVNAGSTVLFRGPNLPLIGTVRITLEAICYSLGMGLRLLVMMGSFCLLTYAVNPDLLLKTFGGGRSKVMLALSMSLRLFPLIADDLIRITEAQRCRGVNFKVKGKWQRVKNYLPVLNTVLLSCLERSFQMAEALQSKAYGSTERSYYREKLWRPRDYLILTATILTLIFAAVLILTGFSGYSYYPRMQSLRVEDFIMATVMGLGLVFPALLQEGWTRCRYLKSRI